MPAKRSLIRGLLSAGTALILTAGLSTPVQADDWSGGSGGGSSVSTSNAAPSSPPKQAVVRDCTVYANGTGMGSYCLGGSGNGKTLRERFSGQEFVPCRYEAPPEWVEVPKNPEPDKGRFLLKRCIEDIDWNTISGGRNMHLTVSLEWVPNGADISAPDNGLSDYLWSRTGNDTALPIPMMRTQPAQIPVVGYPTFFTFTWIDPSTERPIAQGPYAGNPRGGPYREVVNGRGLRMAAQATKVTIDPHLPGVAPVMCDPDNMGYEPGKAAGEQASTCKLTFTRSSAAASKLQVDPPSIPSVYRSAYGLTVTVDWRITYGFGDAPDQELGNGFSMSLAQALPVQEVQAPNEPPIVLF